ncbi:hypothetical protein GWI33_008438 [Rhynchophorus ferrugineus]|uniref:Uncharacterized protein n=1 Tax=Rhynchophorus ferrugineus TaxID=354439 RepID=A0A834MFX5_RHYFE|nr:hypothetical protein GWI33_008438 [Rhynchophorus ferrugineus]
MVLPPHSCMRKCAPSVFLGLARRYPRCYVGVRFPHLRTHPEKLFNLFYTHFGYLCVFFGSPSLDQLPTTAMGSEPEPPIVMFDFVWPLPVYDKGDPASGYATVVIALRLIGALKPHRYDKPETSWWGRKVLQEAIKYMGGMAG